jgi:hypothetical protein
MDKYTKSRPREQEYQLQRGSQTYPTSHTESLYGRSRPSGSLGLCVGNAGVRRSQLNQSRCAHAMQLCWGKRKFTHPGKLFIIGFKGRGHPIWLPLYNTCHATLCQSKGTKYPYCFSHLLCT